MEINQQPLSPKIRARLLLLVITTSITLVLAVTLLIILTLQSFTGITSTPPLVINTCTQAYFKPKYQTASRGMAIVYVTSFFSIGFQIAICVLIFPSLIMRLQPNGCRLNSAFILVALHMLSVITVFGRYLGFHVDLHKMDTGSCTITYSQALINVVLAFATADFGLSFLQFIFMLVTIGSYNQQYEKALKYHQMANTTNQTVENAMDEHFKNLGNFYQRMPIENSKNSKPFQTASTPRRQDIGAKQIIQDQKMEKKQALLAETIKETHKPRPQGRFERMDAVPIYNGAMEMQSKPIPKTDRRDKYEITSSINQVFIPRAPSPQKLKTRSESQIYLQKFPILARQNLQRVENNFDEESQQSMAQERKQYSNLQINMPGPIYTVKNSEPREQKVNQNTRGYLNFVRRMNVRDGDQTEGQLIASIRGKYGR